MGDYFEKDVPYSVTATQWDTGQTMGGLVSAYDCTGTVHDPTDLCQICGEKWEDHGWLPDPAHPILCPDDWVVEMPDGKRVALYPAQFSQAYEEVV